MKRYKDLIRFSIILCCLFIGQKGYTQKNIASNEVAVINQLKTDLGITTEKAGLLASLLSTYSIAIFEYSKKVHSSVGERNRQLRTLFAERQDAIERMLTVEEYRRWQLLGIKRAEARREMKRNKDQKR